MSTVYDQVAERIRDELETLEQIVTRAQDAWSRVQKTPGEQAYVDSVALNLHGIYSGVERLFELIARHVDQRLPSGVTWHRELLGQMACDLAGVRPAVIGEDSAESLDELRRFRHLVRNVYTVNLAPEKMVGLLSRLPALWPKLRAELLAFADFMEYLSCTDTENE